jgi:hypothetical protein
LRKISKHSFGRICRSIDSGLLHVRLLNNFDTVSLFNR